MEAASAEAFKAAWGGDYDKVVKFVNQYPGYIDMQNERKQTMLYCAAHEGHSDIVQFLISKGANMSKTEKTESTPLHVAAFLASEHAKIRAPFREYLKPIPLQILLEEGANTACTNKFKNTPLKEAVALAKPLFRSILPPSHLAYVQNLHDETIIRHIQHNKKVSNTVTTVQYPINPPIELKRGDKLLFEIPPQYRTLILRNIFLTHRKDKTKYGASVEKHRDSEGAYNLVAVRRTGTKYGWYRYFDKYTKDDLAFGGKFAEIRSQTAPEIEGLHDWIHFITFLNIDHVLVTGVGTGENAVSEVSNLAVEFYPPLSAPYHFPPSLENHGENYIEHIFTRGTKFVNLSPDNMILEPSFGGGANYAPEKLVGKSLYPDAIIIGPKYKLLVPSPERAINERIQIKEKQLLVHLPENKRISCVEVACGDTYLETETLEKIKEQLNKDGHYGECGWSKLSGFLKTVDFQTQLTFFEKINVPPQGVISGGSSNAEYKTGRNDFIVISASSFPAFIMGLRISFSNDPTDERD